MILSITISLACGFALGVVVRPKFENLLNRVANVWEQIKVIDW